MIGAEMGLVGSLPGVLHLHYNDVAFDTRRVVDQKTRTH
jgi:hypothetical protein